VLAEMMMPFICSCRNKKYDRGIVLVLLLMMMMMSFICSYRNKNAYMY